MPQAVNTESTTQSAIEQFEHIKIVFMWLEIYIKFPMTAGMTDVISKALVELLCIIAIATHEINKNGPSKFIPGDV
jgi:hypothetical protein